MYFQLLENFINAHVNILYIQEKIKVRVTLSIKRKSMFIRIMLWILEEIALLLLASLSIWRLK